MPRDLTKKLKRKFDRGETCTVTTKLLELLGISMTAWLMVELVGDRPDAEGVPIFMGGYNMAVVSWITRCDGTKDKRTCLLRTMLRRLELTGG